MRDATGEFKAFLAQAKSVQTADLYEITLIDGTKYNLTNADFDIAYAGVTYSANKLIISREATECSVGTKVNTLALNIAVNQNDLVVGTSLLSSIRNGLLDGAKVVLKKIITEGFVASLQQYTVIEELNLDAIANCGTTKDVGKTLTGLDPLADILIFWLDGKYKATDYWVGNPGAYRNTPVGVYNNSLGLNTFVGGRVPGFTTQEEALAWQQAQPPGRVSGGSSYTFWIYDFDPGNNAGGLSLKIMSSRYTFAPSDQTTDAIILFSGLVAECSAGRFSGDINVNSDFQFMNVKMPTEVVQAGCKNQLYGAACKVSKDAFKVSGTVTSSTKIQVVTGLSNPNSYFNRGYVEFTSGINAGKTRYVKGWYSGVMYFTIPLLTACASGDTFNIYPSCDKTKFMCTDRFDNLPNFRGEPYVPAPETGFTG